MGWSDSLLFGVWERFVFDYAALDRVFITRNTLADL